MKIPNDVKRAVLELSNEKRAKVVAIVRRHVEACQRMGVEPEFMDRVWIEAMEAINIEERFEDPFIPDEKWPEYEPVRSYDVYRSPVDMRL